MDSALWLLSDHYAKLKQLTHVTDGSDNCVQEGFQHRNLPSSFATLFSPWSSSAYPNLQACSTDLFRVYSGHYLMEDTAR